MQPLSNNSRKHPVRNACTQLGKDYKAANNTDWSQAASSACCQYYCLPQHPQSYWINTDTLLKHKAANVYASSCKLTVPPPQHTHTHTHIIHTTSTCTHTPHCICYISITQYQFTYAQYWQKCVSELMTTKNELKNKYIKTLRQQSKTKGWVM